MNDTAYISICIPAYKNTNYLLRLLDSIAIQSFTDYEVIITDDSPDATVEKFIKSYTRIPRIRYQRNARALGTPENWNEGIRLASGTWIKLIHDDDWLAHEKVLERFVQATREFPRCSFFFSAFRNIDQASVTGYQVKCSAWDQWLLQWSPLVLYRKVYIGNPSCTFIRRDVGLLYDPQFKWVVDFEYYIRCLRKVKQFQYINETLLHIGFNADQVTRYTFRVPEVEIPESYAMIEKLGYPILRNIFVYDYYWRLHRNLSVRGEDSVKKYYAGNIHPLLRQMIRFQQFIPLPVLKLGVISKLLMFFNYVISLFRKTGMQ